MNNPLSLTKYWLESIVIGLDLCPFAKIPYESGLIRMVECKNTDEDEQMLFFLQELEVLNNSKASDISTSIIVYPFGSTNFHDFNDFIGELESMLVEANLTSTFQIVGFHPKFVFGLSEFIDIGNYVNRSPFPVVHILRTEEVFKVMKNPKDGEKISFINDKKLKELSSEAINKLFFYLNK